MRTEVMIQKTLVLIFLIFLVCGVSDLSWSQPRLELPVGGVRGVDWAICQYVDLDPQKNQVRDYRDGRLTYDGHRGVDFCVPNFRWMDKGFQILAAAAGQVTATYDRSYDRTLLTDFDFRSCRLWNYVMVTHSDGSSALYGHLKTGSVVVSVGQKVSPGQVLGVIGSSGCSLSPHLHFELRSANGKIVDPFLEKLWIDPPPYEAPVRLMDYNVTDREISGRKDVLDPAPNATSISVESTLGIGIIIADSSRGDVVRLTLHGGDNRLESSVSKTFDRPSAWTWRYWNFPVKGNPGTWRIKIYLNDILAASHDISVGTTALPPAAVLSLSKVSGDNQSGTPGTRLPSPFVVKVTDSKGQGVSGKQVTFSVNAGDGRLSTTSAPTDSNGLAETYLALGNSTRTNRVTASVTGVPSLTFIATAEIAPAPPALLMITDESEQKGIPNRQLTAPLAVQVLDDDGNGVADVRVSFRVTAGQGRLTARSSGRTVVVSTNSQGFAQVTFTPTRAGTLTVQASVVGLNPVVFTVNAGLPPAKLVQISGGNQHGTPNTRLAKPFVVEVQNKKGEFIEGIVVTFRVTAGGGRLSATRTTTSANGRAQTFLILGKARTVNKVQASVSGVDIPVTFSASIEPKVLIAEETRPLMYWIDTATGTIHRLIGAKVESLLPRVQNATSLIVDATAGKLYWTEKTSNHTGKIRTANLDGSNVQLVRRLTSVPLHITLDPVAGKLYLINSWRKIQRLNVDGSAFQPNLITGLQAPRGFAVDPAGGKVYWIAQTSKRTGKIQTANLDGSDVQLVKDLTSVPQGIAIDTKSSKLYITNAWGKVQRMNPDGQNYQSNLITGLKSPMGVTVDSVGRKVYWMERGSLRRAGLSGKNIEDVVTNLGPIANLVLGTVPVDMGGLAAPTAVALVSGKTALLANYPNPFNPETWIPYQLSEPADVTLTIYTVNGHVVRQLTLGLQPAGMYQSRSRAAYWDGRNAFGEPVASGPYFYALTAGDFTATRKMLILK